MEKQIIGSKSKKTSGRKYYRYALANLLRMGHCAPTVMKTILDISPAEKEWLVRLSAGMPGGIGNTGFECGGVPHLWFCWVRDSGCPMTTMIFQ